MTTTTLKIIQFFFLFVIWLSCDEIKHGKERCSLDIKRKKKRKDEKRQGIIRKESYRDGERAKYKYASTNRHLESFFGSSLIATHTHTETMRERVRIERQNSNRDSDDVKGYHKSRDVCAH
jgi:hypothetical protein